MISSEAHSAIRAILSKHISDNISSFEVRSVGGGSINESYQILLNGGLRYFCKLNSTISWPDFFEKEKKGIQLLQNKQVIRLPQVIACTSLESGMIIIIMDWIDQGLKNERFWIRFGEQLAALHRVSNHFYGLDEDNYMGALPQSNHPCANWIDFFINERLKLQIEIARKKNLLENNHIRQFEKLYSKLSEIFSQEIPSLIHGDLWSGNFLSDERGNPVLIDPAVYYGHRCMDLAMTTLFGGFDKKFYDVYNYHFPFPSNYQEQWQICNLYPLLIHLNLFGKAYLNDIVNTIKHY